MMHISFGDYAAWLLCFGLQVTIAWLILQQSLVRQYRPVFLYLLFWMTSNPILFLLRGHYVPYFYTYWAAQVVSYCLQFLIAKFLFSSLARRLDSTTVKMFLLCVCFITASIIFYQHYERRDFVGISIGFLVRTQDALYFIRASIFLLMLVFAKSAGLRNDGHNFKLTAGYGLYASAELVLTGLQTQAPDLNIHLVPQIRTWMYAASLLVWLRAFLPRAPLKEETCRRTLLATVHRLEKDRALLENQLEHTRK